MPVQSQPIRQLLRRAGALLLCSIFIGAAAAPPAAPAVAQPAKAAEKPKAKSLETGAAMSPEQRALHERIDQAKLGVAGLHRGKQGLSCGKCHAEKVAVAPDDNQTVENRECVACHEDYPGMAAITAKKLSNKAINPHDSHLGPEIACTSCHQGHQESKSYCLNCHTNFVMPMPGNGPAAR